MFIQLPPPIKAPRQISSEKALLKHKNRLDIIFNEKSNSLHKSIYSELKEHLPKHINDLFTNKQSILKIMTKRSKSKTS
jgi:hypothetical protein